MKRTFFVISCLLCLSYVWTECIGEEKMHGVMNANLNVQHGADNRHYFPNAVDVFWTFADAPSSSERPFLPAYSVGK